MTTGAVPATPALRDIDIPLSSSVLDAVACLVLVVERESGRVVQVNQGLETLLGRPSAGLVGGAWEDLVDPADRTAMCQAIAHPGGPLSGIETGLATLEAGPRRVLWSVASHDRTGDGTHVVLSGIDVTREGPAAGLFSQLMRTATTPALVATDVAGRVTLFNTAAEQLIGYPAADIIGKTLDLGIFDRDELVERAERLGVPADLRLLAGDLTRLDRRRRNLDLGELDRRRQRADDRGASEGAERRERRGTIHDRRPGGSLARDWTLVRRDGGRFTASLQIVKVTDDAGAVTGYLGVARDVTEERRSRNLLVAGLEREAEAVRRLKELDRAKDDFVATVSHELRTPITSILGYVEVLLDGISDIVEEHHVEMLQAVRRNGNRLRRTAEDLLTLSSFESGEFTLDLAELDLGVLVRRVEQSLHPYLAGRSLETAFAVPERPVTVTGDEAHLERVLFHLLSNALKFTEDGGSITCSLSLDGGDAVLEVSDTGVGVPVAEQEQLFTPFFRSSTSRERASQGAGMGLAIVSAIVERHGGQVALDSDGRSGTRVAVRLPVKRSAPAV